MKVVLEEAFIVVAMLAIKGKTIRLLVWLAKIVRTAISMMPRVMLIVLGSRRKSGRSSLVSLTGSRFRLNRLMKKMRIRILWKIRNNDQINNFITFDHIMGLIVTIIMDLQ